MMMKTIILVSSLYNCESSGNHDFDRSKLGR